MLRESDGGPSPRIRSLRALTVAVRRVVEGTVRTGMGPAGLDGLTLDAHALADQLLATVDGDPRAARSHGPGLAAAGDLYATNPALGSCNPVAPEVTIELGDDGTVRGTVRFGLAHGGPPGLAHGGVIALVLDQVLGIATQAVGHPGVTAELIVRFRRPTRIEQVLAFEARHVATTGRRGEAWGAIYDADGAVTAEASAIFVVPSTKPDQRPTA